MTCLKQWQLEQAPAEPPQDPEKDEAWTENEWIEGWMFKDWAVE